MGEIMIKQKTTNVCILGFEIENLINYLKNNNETIEALHLYVDPKFGDIKRVSVETSAESDKEGYRLTKQYTKDLENYALPFSEALEKESAIRYTLIDK